MLASIRKKVAGLFQKAITDWLQRTNNRLVSENPADWFQLSEGSLACFFLISEGNVTSLMTGFRAQHSDWFQLATC